MNEVTLHRGRSPHLTMIDAYVDGQHLTESVVSAGRLRPKPEAMTGVPLTVRWPHSLNTHRLHCILSIFWGTNCPSVDAVVAVNSYLPAQPFVQTSDVTWNGPTHAKGKYR